MEKLCPLPGFDHFFAWSKDKSRIDEILPGKHLLAPNRSTNCISKWRIALSNNARGA